MSSKSKFVPHWFSLNQPKVAKFTKFLARKNFYLLGELPWCLKAVFPIIFQFSLLSINLETKEMVTF